MTRCHHPGPRNSGRWLPAVRPGDVVCVEEGDHRGGVGRLLLEVIEVGRRELHADGIWIHVRGVELSQPDRVRLRQRFVVVRLAALVAARRGGRGGCNWSPRRQ